MYKLAFFVPEADIEPVKQAVFASGAGRLGNYGECCWQTLGQGQFRPMLGANPAIGEVGALERVTEWRVEMLCPPDCIEAALSALRQAHPYEEPAYEVWPLLDL